MSILCTSNESLSQLLTMNKVLKTFPLFFLENNQFFQVRGTFWHTFHESFLFSLTWEFSVVYEKCTSYCKRQLFDILRLKLRQFYKRAERWGGSGKGARCKWEEEINIQLRLKYDLTSCHGIWSYPIYKEKVMTHRW